MKKPLSLLAIVFIFGLFAQASLAAPTNTPDAFASLMAKSMASETVNCVPGTPDFCSCFVTQSKTNCEKAPIHPRGLNCSDINSIMSFTQNLFGKGNMCNGIILSCKFEPTDPTCTKVYDAFVNSCKSSYTFKVTPATC